MGKPPAEKPPAPSVKKRAPPGPETNAQVVGEIYTAFQRLDADEELLAIVGSWRDGLSDDDAAKVQRRPADPLS
jgi:hypothetical protein